MTGDSSILDRKRMIRKIEALDSVILVATQVVEAGVDIDMDIGYKDISRLDSEEQFMGRINRSCKGEGIQALSISLIWIMLRKYTVGTKELRRIKHW